MRKTTNVFFLLTLLFLISCDNKKKNEDLKIVSLRIDKKIDMLSDSTFFKNIFCILEDGDDIFMSIDQRMQIVRLDQDMNLLATIGRQGRGPREFVNIECFALYDDDIFVGESSKQGIMRFSKEGEFKSLYKVSEYGFPYSPRFTIDDGKYYFYKLDEEKVKSIRSLSVDNMEAESFGEMTDFDFKMKNLIQNRRNVFNFHDDLIVSPQSIMVVERYNKKTHQLTEKYDLSEVPIVKNVYDERINDPFFNTSNAGYYIFSDSYLKDNLLYIACPVKSKNESEMPHTEIMVFDVLREIKYVKHLIVEEWLSCFCVTDKYLFAVPLSGGELIRYKLES